MIPMTPRTEFRMTIRDVFDIQGQGVVVLGTIESGAVRVGGDLMLISPTARLVVRVASVRKFKAHNLQEASAGPEDVGIGLAGITREQVSANDILVGSR